MLDHRNGTNLSAIKTLNLFSKTHQIFLHGLSQKWPFYHEVLICQEQWYWRCLYRFSYFLLFSSLSGLLDTSLTIVLLAIALSLPWSLECLGCSIFFSSYSRFFSAPKKVQSFPDVLITFSSFVAVAGLWSLWQQGWSDLLF